MCIRDRPKTVYKKFEFFLAPSVLFIFTLISRYVAADNSDYIKFQLNILYKNDHDSMSCDEIGKRCCMYKSHGIDLIFLHTYSVTGK